FLLVLIFIITIYSILTSDVSNATLVESASAHNSAAPNWLIGSMLYVSYNIAAGVSMLAIIVGTVKDRKIASRGGILGELGLGLLLFLINLGLFMNIEKRQEDERPPLFLAYDLSPVLGVLMSLALLGILYNTAVGMLYSFTGLFVLTGTHMF